MEVAHGGMWYGGCFLVSDKVTFKPGIEVYGIPVFIYIQAGKCLIVYMMYTVILCRDVSHHIGSHPLWVFSAAIS